MPIRIGDYAANQSAAVEPGIYNGIVESVALVTDGRGGALKNDDGKYQVDFFVRIDRQVVVKRRFTVSFGQSTKDRQWAGYAKAVEAITGIRCGDPAQKEVTDEQMQGERVRVKIETSDKGYSNITEFTSATKAAPRNVAAPAAVNPRPAPVNAQEQDYEDESGRWEGLSQ